MISEKPSINGALAFTTTDKQLGKGNKKTLGKGSASRPSKKSALALKKVEKFPNKSTRWSYYMQAIEPNSKEINSAFPGYHPMWVIQSQNKPVSAEYFRSMREFILDMNCDQCAAYLRVRVTQIKRWESGKDAIPFAVFELLRVVSESVHFKLSNKNWQGWFIDTNGRLVSPDRGRLSFSPDELSYVRETHQVKSMYETENKLLRAEIEPLRAELAKRQAMDSYHDLLNELKAIEQRLADVADEIANSNVVHINHIKNTAMKEKAA